MGRREWLRRWRCRRRKLVFLGVFGRLVEGILAREGDEGGGGGVWLGKQQLVDYFATQYLVNDRYSE